MANTNPIPVDVQPWRYIVAVLVALAFLPIVWFLLPILGGIHFGKTTIWYSYLIEVLLILYFLASIKKVQTNELGGIMILEHEALEVGRGYKFVPLGLAELHKFPRAIQQEQFPANPEMISKMPDDQEMRTEMMRPIYATSAPPVPVAAGGDVLQDDILNSRLTLEPTFTIQWQVEKKGFFEFYININGEAWSDKYLFLTKLMRDSGEKALTIAIARRTPAQVNAERGAIANEVRAAVAQATANWGITICEVNVLGLEPDHATNTAMAKIPQAKAEAQAAVITAEGAKRAAIVKSEGDAKARENLLGAEGKGIDVAAKAIGMKGERYWGGEIAKATIGAGTVIIEGEGSLGKIVGIADTIVARKP